MSLWPKVAFQARGSELCSGRGLVGYIGHSRSLWVAAAAEAGATVPASAPVLAGAGGWPLYIATHGVPCLSLPSSEQGHADPESSGLCLTSTFHFYQPEARSAVKKTWELGCLLHLGAVGKVEVGSNLSPASSWPAV